MNHTIRISYSLSFLLESYWNKFFCLFSSIWKKWNLRRPIVDAREPVSAPSIAELRYPTLNPLSDDPCCHQLQNADSVHTWHATQSSSFQTTLRPVSKVRSNELGRMNPTLSSRASARNASNQNESRGLMTFWITTLQRQHQGTNLLCKTLCRTEFDRLKP